MARKQKKELEEERGVPKADDEFTSMDLGGKSVLAHPDLYKLFPHRNAIQLEEMRNTISRHGQTGKVLLLDKGDHYLLLDGHDTVQVVGLLQEEAPAEVTPVIRDALRQISISTPFFIDITPLPGCAPMRCYQNVDSCIRRQGGSREEGWIVYEGWGGRYLKLIHHCLWRSPKGLLVDVTPSDEVRNLFVPDSIRNDGEGVPSRYIALDAAPEVAETIAFCDQMDRQHMELFRRLLGGEGQFVRQPNKCTEVSS